MFTSDAWPEVPDFEPYTCGSCQEKELRISDAQDFFHALCEMIYSRMPLDIDEFSRCFQELGAALHTHFTTAYDEPQIERRHVFDQLQWAKETQAYQDRFLAGMRQ